MVIRNGGCSQTMTNATALAGNTSRSVLVAGGGIGGLSAALALAKQGFAVTVAEQASEFAEVGAGIQLSPNALAALFDLGLRDALELVAFVPEGTQMRHWRRGRVIASSQLGAAAIERYGFPYFHIHRADLMTVLVEAAEAQPLITLARDTAVSGFAQSNGVVTATTNRGEIQADVLIGADGIHSAVRTGLFGDDAPSFTGNVAWRALVPASRLPKGLIAPMATVWWGPGKHFVHYYVRRGELVNCVCVVEKDGWTTESWTEPGDLAELKADFAGWHPDLQTLIDAIDDASLYKWALHDRAPMPRWSKGAVTLLGDACHPTLPFMAQGAAMALEDGAVLARCLLVSKDVSTALMHYEELRRARTAGIQRGSRRNAKVFHLRGVVAWLRNRAAGKASASALDAVYRYNPLTALDG